MRGTDWFGVRWLLVAWVMIAVLVWLIPDVKWFLLEEAMTSAGACGVFALLVLILWMTDPRRKPKSPKARGRVLTPHQQERMVDRHQLEAIQERHADLAS